MRWEPPERRLYVIVNDNVEAAMRDKRMSVHDLADGCGMSRTTLQWRLSRPSTWQIDELPEVAAALGVSVSSLFGVGRRTPMEQICPTGSARPRSTCERGRCPCHPKEQPSS